MGLAHAREYIPRRLGSWLSRIELEECDSVCQRSEFQFIQLYRLLRMHIIVSAKLTTRKRQSFV